LDDDQIDNAIEKCGFTDRGTIYMDCTRPDKKSVLYIKSGIVKMIKVPKHKFEYPKNKVMEKLRKLISRYDITLLPITMEYRNARSPKNPSYLKNHDGHCGVVRISGSNCMYYDALRVKKQQLKRNRFHDLLERKLESCLKKVGVQKPDLHCHVFDDDGP